MILEMETGIKEATSHPSDQWRIFAACDQYFQGSYYLLILKFKEFFKNFQGPSNFIFKDQFSTEVYSMTSRTVMFNYDAGTVIR